MSGARRESKIKIPSRDNSSMESAIEIDRIDSEEGSRPLADADFEYEGYGTQSALSLLDQAEQV